MSEHADLRCESCDRVTDHELRYSGRLLDSVRCTTCGTRVAMSPRVLFPAYVHDLEQRLSSKPGRLVRRACADPVGFALALPRATVRQPVKLARELWNLVRP